MSVFVYVFVFNLYLSCEGMLVRKWPLNDLTGSEPSQGRQFCARRTFLPLLIVTIFLVCEFVSHIFSGEPLCICHGADFYLISEIASRLLSLHNQMETCHVPIS